MHTPFQIESFFFRWDAEDAHSVPTFNIFFHLRDQRKAQLHSFCVAWCPWLTSGEASAATLRSYSCGNAPEAKCWRWQLVSVSSRGWIRAGHLNARTFLKQILCGRRCTRCIHHSYIQCLFSICVIKEKPNFNASVLHDPHGWHPALCTFLVEILKCKFRFLVRSSDI